LKTTKDVFPELQNGKHKHITEGLPEKGSWSVTHFPFWVDEICYRQTHIHQKPKAY